MKVAKLPDLRAVALALAILIANAMLADIADAQGLGEAFQGFSANSGDPIQIEADRLLIQRDHVIRDMLARIGAEVAEVVEPFTPEGGAYGHGRTHGHDHSHDHGAGGHQHAHDH